jgi:hypothetical protein
MASFTLCALARLQQAIPRVAAVRQPRCAVFHLLGTILTYCRASIGDTRAAVLTGSTTAAAAAFASTSLVMQ